MTNATQRRWTAFLMILALILLGVVIALVGLIAILVALEKGWSALPALVMFAGTIGMFLLIVWDTVDALPARDEWV